MNAKFEACKIIHNKLLPRTRFLRASFVAMAEQEFQDGSKDGASIYEGAVLALDDIIAEADNLIAMLGRSDRLDPSMMYCANCGTEIDRQTAVCPVCKTSFEGGRPMFG